MNPTRLLAIAALALASGTTCAYEIIESRYRVEIAPGQFQDQLVLKCDNGRKVTVPWDAKLYEACGEDLMGRPIKGGNPEDVAQDRQKEVMMSRLREQYGDIDERHVKFESGPTGVSMQFQGPIRDILKRYEICRKQTKNSPTCVSERDQAMAALSAKGGAAAPTPAAEPVEAAQAEPVPEAKPAGEPRPAAKSKKSAGKAKPAAQPDTAAAEAGGPARQVTEVAPAQGRAKAPAQPAVAAQEAAPVAPAETAVAPAVADELPPAAPATSQVSAEQKIAQDYAWCMRAKPRFECDQARAKALSALNKPKPAKPAGKSKGGNDVGPMKAVYSDTVRQ